MSFFERTPSLRDQMPFCMVKIVHLLTDLIIGLPSIAERLLVLGAGDRLFATFGPERSQLLENIDIAKAYCNFLRQHDVDELKAVLTLKDATKVDAKLLVVMDNYEQIHQKLDVCDRWHLRDPPSRQGWGLKHEAVSNAQVYLKTVNKGLREVYKLVTQKTYTTSLETDDLVFMPGSKPLETLCRKSEEVLTYHPFDYNYLG